MTGNVASSAHHESAGPPRGRWVEWLLCGTSASLLAYVGAARLPQEAKVPVVLSTGLAAALGFGLGHLAGVWKLQPRRSVVTVVGLWIALGLFAGAWDTHRRLARFASRERLEVAPDLGGLDNEFQKMLDSGKLPDNLQTTIEGGTIDEESRGTVPIPQTADRQLEREELRRMLDKQQKLRADRKRERQLKHTFLGYLVFRIPREWGRWPVPAAVTFWLAEVAVAVCIGSRLACGAFDQSVAVQPPAPPPTD